MSTMPMSGTRRAQPAGSQRTDTARAAHGAYPRSEAVPLRVLPRTRAYAYWAKVSQNGPEPSPEIELARSEAIESKNAVIALDLVQPDAFYLNSQQHVLLESILFAVIHAEIRAVEGARGVGAANLLLEHGMIKAFE